MTTATKTKPTAPTDASYERDLHGWCFEQAAHLRAGRFDRARVDQIAEELEELGRSQRAALRSSYRVLITHLLKWRHQPEKRSRSWDVTISRERNAILDREEDNRSLANMAGELIEEVYPRALRQAAKETGLDPSVFPRSCPFSLAFLRDEDAMPEADDEGRTAPGRRT